MSALCQWTDQKIMEAMRGSFRERNLALKYLYEQSDLYALTFAIVVKKSQGTEEDAQDVFNESLQILARHLRQGRFQGKSKLSTYYYRIALRTWLHYKEKQGEKALQLADNVPEAGYDPNESYYNAEERKTALQRAMRKLGRRSQQILHLWANDFTMQEIADIVDLGNSERAKKETQRSRERLRKIVAADPALTQQLLSAYRM